MKLSQRQITYIFDTITILYKNAIANKQQEINDYIKGVVSMGSKNIYTITFIPTFLCLLYPNKQFVLKYKNIRTVDGMAGVTLNEMVCSLDNEIIYKHVFLLMEMGIYFDS